jgi:hypothetical protein
MKNETREIIIIEDLLGRLIDWIGVDQVLTMIVSICHKQADEMAAKSTDPALEAARVWTEAANRVETVILAGQECGVD